MSRAPLLVLVHGWGQSPRSLRRLAESCGAADAVGVDLGFFGAPSLPSLPAGRPVVAVAHSLGLLWLLRERPFRWEALVSIAGMARFTRAEDFPAGVPPRVLQRMRTRLEREPRPTLEDFWYRAAAPELGPTADEGLDAVRLGDGLRWLAEWDERGALAADRSPTLALAARDDEIVPAALTEALFAGRPDTRLAWSDAGGHALPWTQAAWCAEQVTAFVEELR